MKADYETHWGVRSALDQTEPIGFREINPYREIAKSLETVTDSRDPQDWRSPATGGDSLFTRTNHAHYRVASSGMTSPPRNDERLRASLEICRQYAADRSTKWSIDSKRGPNEVLGPKCTMFDYEIDKRSGLEPFYNSLEPSTNTKDGYSATHEIASHPYGFRCWRPVENPQPGDRGVYWGYSSKDPKHAYGHEFIVVKRTGLGCSAGRDAVKEWTHFKWQGDHAAPTDPNMRHEKIIFFENFCPGMQTSDKLIFD